MVAVTFAAPSPVMRMPSLPSVPLSVVSLNVLPVTENVRLPLVVLLIWKLSSLFWLSVLFESEPVPVTLLSSMPRSAGGGGARGIAVVVNEHPRASETPEVMFCRNIPASVVFWMAPPVQLAACAPGAVAAAGAGDRQARRPRRGVVPDDAAGAAGGVDLGEAGGAGELLTKFTAAALVVVTLTSPTVSPSRRRRRWRCPRCRTPG